MSKRSQGAFKRNVHDLYNTRDPRAVAPLLPFLKPQTHFIEPCFGKGALARQLADAGHVCVMAADIAFYPETPNNFHGDATRDDYRGIVGFDCFISNPPWTRSILHAIIANLSAQAPTWLLFDADWAYRATTPAALFDHCSHIVAVGRIRWMLGEPGDKGHDPKDNCAWYRFSTDHVGGPRFYGRGR